jgi:hypothetical protein
VTWQSLGQDGSGAGVFARRFDATGVPQAAEFQVNSFTSGYQGFPDVAMTADGSFAIVWHSPQDGSSNGVFAKRFDSLGAVQATEFQINSRTENVQNLPAVGYLEEGGFVAIWQSYNGDASNFGILARRFDSQGTGAASDSIVNTFTQGAQDFPALGTSDSGFVVVWESAGQDGQGDGIFAQRLLPTSLAILDIDGNGQMSPLTDGLLILRHRFGFTGSSLIGGAVAVDCTRCLAADIANYIAGLGNQLDIDNNGALDALTDGLLVLRFAFGFTGATLTSNAVAPNCVTRCDSSNILAYLQTLD